MENAPQRAITSVTPTTKKSKPFALSLNSLTLALLVLSTALGFAACQQKPKTEAAQSQGQQPSLSQQQQPANPVLSEYEQFLMHLDSTDVTNVGRAANKYAALFKGQPHTVADSGYVLFDEFYLRVDHTINNIHYKDTTDYSSLVLMSNEQVPRTLSKKLKEYRNTMTTNGFNVTMTEGFTYLQQDRDFIARHFYAFISPTLKEYLTQLNKENKEGYSEDGGLTITPTQLADRVIWRENFIKDHPDFILLDEAKIISKNYLTTLLEGMDNTPVLGFGTNKLDPEYAEAYQYLQKKAPTSTANKLVQPYFKALQKADTAQANVLLKRYEAEGTIGY